MGQRILLRGGYVLSLDPEVGELPRGDVLVQDGRIAAVGADLGPLDAEVADASGHVVLPGFVDTHRHTWQTPYRGVCADWTLEEYFRRIRMSISPNCAAADVYAGNLAGALEALDAGVTTVLDFSHCMNTPEHADAALAGLREAGIRAVLAYGYFPAATAEPGFADHAARLADARRLRETELASDDALVTMGVALTECGLLPFEATAHEARSARELGVPAVLHTGCSWGSLVTEGLPELDHHGLLGPEQIHVHGNTLRDRDLRRLAERECKLSVSPETELQMGMGFPVIGRALAHGLRPSLSCDVVSSSSGDMFAQMRLGLQVERTRQNAEHHARGEMPPTLELGVRDALRWGIANGAHALGMEERIRSLTPGKQADIVVIGGRRLNLVPMADPVGCLVAQANAADVRDVLVAGRWVKRDGSLLRRSRPRDPPGRGDLRARARPGAGGGRRLAPPPAPPGFADMLNTAAAQNLARAWTMDPAA